MFYFSLGYRPQFKITYRVSDYAGPALWPRWRSPRWLPWCRWAPTTTVTHSFLRRSGCSGGGWAHFCRPGAWCWRWGWPEPYQAQGGVQATRELRLSNTWKAGTRFKRDRGKQPTRRSSPAQDNTRDLRFLALYCITFHRKNKTIPLLANIQRYKFSRM